MNIDANAMARDLGILSEPLHVLLYPNDPKRPDFHSLEEAREAHKDAGENHDTLRATWALASWRKHARAELHAAHSFDEALQAWRRSPPNTGLERPAIRVLCVYASKDHMQDLGESSAQYVVKLARRHSDASLLDEVLQQLARLYPA